MPEKPQALEEQKFRLKMEESCLNLEAETAAKDRETRIAILRKDLGELENGYGHPVWQGNTVNRAQKFRR